MKTNRRFPGIYPVEINYDLGLDALVVAARQHWVSRSFTAKNLPLTGKGVRQVSLEVFEFDEDVPVKEYPRLIEASGFQVEGPAELVALRTSYPGLVKLDQGIGALKILFCPTPSKIYVPYASEKGLGLLLLTSFPRDFGILVSRL